MSLGGYFERPVYLRVRISYPDSFVRPINAPVRKDPKGIGNAGVSELHPDPTAYCQEFEYESTTIEKEYTTKVEYVDHFSGFKDGIVALDHVMMQSVPIVTIMSREVKTVRKWKENSCLPGERTEETEDVFFSEWVEDKDANEAAARKTRELIDRQKRIREIQNELAPINPINGVMPSPIPDYVLSIIKHGALDPRGILGIRDNLPSTGQIVQSSGKEDKDNELEYRLVGYQASNDPETVVITKGVGITNRDSVTATLTAKVGVTREQMASLGKKYNNYSNPDNVDWDTGTVTKASFVPFSGNPGKNYVDYKVTYGYWRIFVSVKSGK